MALGSCARSRTLEIRLWLSLPSTAAGETSWSALSLLSPTASPAGPGGSSRLCRRSRGCGSFRPVRDLRHRDHPIFGDAGRANGELAFLGGEFEHFDLDIPGAGRKVHHIATVFVG